MPMLGSNDAPATTGSLAAPVQVEQPLPPRLAYSDAAKIGQTAADSLWDETGGPGEWLNAATGSSGTVEKSAGAGSESCRPFQTIVTSIGGVHSYSGHICKEANGASIVHLAAIAEEAS
jgi:hypothetical protein